MLFLEISCHIKSGRIFKWLSENVSEHLYWCSGNFLIAGFFLLELWTCMDFPCFSCGNEPRHWNMPYFGNGLSYVKKTIGVWSRSFCLLVFAKLGVWNYCVLHKYDHFFKIFNYVLQCPRGLEEHESLTSHDGIASALTAGFLVDLGLDASTPDTYRPPPAPLPYDFILGCPQSPDSLSAGGTIIGSSFGTLTSCEDLEESDCKAQANSLCVSPRKLEGPNLNEPNVSSADEEDVCPICLEGALPGNWCFSSLYSLSQFACCQKYNSLFCIDLWN